MLQHRKPRSNRKDDRHGSAILSLRAPAAGLAVTGVPSFEHARIRGESNLNTFRDGRRVLKTILTEWRNR